MLLKRFKESSVDLFGREVVRVQLVGAAVHEQSEQQVESLDPRLVDWNVQNPADYINDSLQLHLGGVGQGRGELVQHGVHLLGPLLHQCHGK